MDIFSDRKIKELRGKFGADGMILYLYLLCQIYKDNGYYLTLDDGFDYVLSADLGMESEKIGLILNFLCKRSLFDDKLFTSDKVLTSRGIQTRFQEIVKARGQKNDIAVDKRLWVLREDETHGYIKLTQFSDNSVKKADNSKKKEHISTEKSHKVKESKVKEIKVNESKEYLSVSKDTEYCAAAQRTADEWNTLEVYGIKKIIKIVPVTKRHNSLTARIRQYGLEAVINAIDNIRSSNFLQGRNKTGWVITFDWFVLPNNFVKVLEGNYNNTQSAVAQSSGNPFLDALHKMEDDEQGGDVIDV